MPNRIVIALGGNAIEASDGTSKSQIASIKRTMKSIVKFVENGDKIVITHGNGPQVGNLLLKEINGSTPNNPPMPLDTEVAMTQGSIGYWMQNSLDEILSDNNLKYQSVALVTQVEVKSDDKAFSNPTKPIGPFYNKSELSRVESEHPDYSYREDAGRGYRQVVPSPAPVRIIESPIVSNLLSYNIIPIAVGGGGIPVVRDEYGHLHGVSAVIDKDFGASKLAQDIGADKLIILTAVDNVYVNFNSPNQKALYDVTIDELESYISQKQFDVGSMLPKVKASIQFVKNTGKEAIITSLQNVEKLVNGERVGTVIKKN